MHPNLLNFSGLALAYLVLFGICEILYHKFDWNAENTRKVAHAGSGTMALSFPAFFESFGYVAALCAAFLGILFLTKQMRLLRSIHGIARVSYGSSMFPIVVAVCFWFYSQDHNLAKFYLPVLIMALADPIACLVGRRFPIVKIWGKKTLGGSTGFFLTAFSICGAFYVLIALHKPTAIPFALCFTISLVATVAEMVSNKGFDNLTIPLSVLGVLAFFEPV
jgi:phytol kinase